MKLTPEDRMYGIHMSHCNMGDYRGVCKYSDHDECPALTKFNTLDGYHMIANYYGDKKTARSKVPLMNHIDEGLIIMDALGASREAMEAFCIHPIIQADKDLKDNRHLFIPEASIPQYCYDDFPLEISPYVMMLAMEYRFRANSFLSNKVFLGSMVFSLADPSLSPLEEVNHMLIADKVQNRKDFEKYHIDTHARTVELDYYFKRWLEALHVSEDEYHNLVALVNDKSAPK